MNLCATHNWYYLDACEFCTGERKLEVRPVLTFDTWRGFTYYEPTKKKKSKKRKSKKDLWPFLYNEPKKPIKRLPAEREAPEDKDDRIYYCWHCGAEIGTWSFNSGTWTVRSFRNPEHLRSCNIWHKVKLEDCYRSAWSRRPASYGDFVIDDYAQHSRARVPREETDGGVYVQHGQFVPSSSFYNLWFSQ